MTPNFVLDCGQNDATIYDTKTGSVKKIRHSEALNLPESLPAGSVIVCEYAHLGCPRRERSLSQPFSAGELLHLYERFRDRNIILKLFPHQSTPRAINYARGVTNDPEREKGDMQDPESLFLLLKDFPEISLMNPPSSFELTDVRKESYDWVADSNMYLNIARRYKYVNNVNPEESVEFGEKRGDVDFITQNIQRVYEMVSESCRSAFGLKCYKRGNKKTGTKAGEVNLNEMKKPQVYSVLTQLVRPDGSLRFRSNGQLASWKFVKRYSIKMTPFHFKGGVARSNLYYHGARHWVAARIADELGVTSESIKKKRRGGYVKEEDGKYVEGFNAEENRLFRKYRTEYCNAVRELFRAFKTIAEEQIGVHENIQETADSAV